jgi:hypothetical protein
VARTALLATVTSRDKAVKRQFVSSPQDDDDSDDDNKASLPNAMQRAMEKKAFAK